MVISKEITPSMVSMSMKFIGLQDLKGFQALGLTRRDLDALRFSSGKDALHM